jgi:hypothetical protein
MTVRERLAQLLASPRAPLWAAAVALLLCLPSLAAGEFLDDHLMRAQARAGVPAWDRYVFVRPEQVAELREQGTFGWWAADELNVSYFRPISALTHALDYAIWPDAVWLMHLESALIYAALTWLVARLVQRVHGSGMIAGIAGLVFAIDESHAGTAYWISGRNTMLAAAFGVLALLAHLRWRGREREARGGWPWALLAALALAASLLSAEAGLCSAGYLLAWSLCCERGHVLARLAPVAPYVLVIAVWRIAYVSAGFGAAHSSIYLDIGATPLLFAWRSLVFSPALTFTTLSLPITDVILARPWTSGVLALAGVLLIWAIAPLLRSDARARAWLLGMMFAAVPFAATWPTTRLLPVLSIGGAALIGLVHHSWRTGELQGRLRRVAYGLMLVCNLVLAPVLFVFAGLSTGLLEAPHRTLAAELPDDAGPCVILNSPTEITNLYTKAIRESAGQRWPLPSYLLYVGIEPLEVVRTGERTLELTSERGWAGEQLDRLSRDWREGFVVGQRVGLAHAEVTVLAVTADGRPRQVRVELDRSLDEVAIYGFGRSGQPGTTLDRWRPAIGERETFRAGILR